MLWGGWELLRCRHPSNPASSRQYAAEASSSMTSIAIALAIDARGPSALYIISDSRLTFYGNSEKRWDAAQKTFASLRTPDIFGFCGDAIFPPAVLRQILEQINYGLIFHDSMNSQ